MGISVSLPRGAGSLEVRLPQGWRLLGELRPKHVHSTAEPDAACAQALMSPIGAPRLAQRDLRGKRVLMVVDDHSRPTPVKDFIHPVLRELAAAGVKEEDVEILIATGVHRESRPDEVEGKVGSEVMARYRWSCHNAHDPEGLIDLGGHVQGHPRASQPETGVRRPRRLSGICGASPPARFRGGLKMIIPGCAGARTIGTNHLQGADADHFDYVGSSGDQSPMRLDLEEGAALLGREVFIVNAAMNEKARPTRFFCGDPVGGHESAP